MNKKNNFRSLLNKIEKIYNTGNIISLREEFKNRIDTISSGSIALDIALGIGGYPKGRIVEIFGPESSGKTTLGLHAVSECQREGGSCIFIDTEHAFDKEYAKKIGIKIDQLVLSQPDSGEQALEIIDFLIKGKVFDLIIVDSVAALTSISELSYSISANSIGAHAKLMSYALKRMTSNIAKSNTLLIFINQIRMKIGIIFGNPETTTGGNALKFYSSIRLDIRRISPIRVKKIIIGNLTKVKIVKNKLAAPFKIVEFNLIYGLGISKEDELIQLGMSTGMILKNNFYYYCSDFNKFLTKKEVRSFINHKNGLYRNIKKQIIEIFFSR